MALTRIRERLLHEKRCVKCSQFFLPKTKEDTKCFECILDIQTIEQAKIRINTRRNKNIYSMNITLPSEQLK